MTGAVFSEHGAAFATVNLSDPSPTTGKYEYTARYDFNNGTWFISHDIPHASIGVSAARVVQAWPKLRSIIFNSSIGAGNTALEGYLLKRLLLSQTYVGIAVSMMS